MDTSFAALNLEKIVVEEGRLIILAANKAWAT